MRRSSQVDDAGNRLVANNESNGRFHSDWLSMMYPRLRLAQKLLRDDGVIFMVKKLQTSGWVMKIRTIIY